MDAALCDETTLASSARECSLRNSPTNQAVKLSSFDHGFTFQDRLLIKLRACFYAKTGRTTLP